MREKVVPWIKGFIPRGEISTLEKRVCTVGRGDVAWRRGFASWEEVCTVGKWGGISCIKKKRFCTTGWGLYCKGLSVERGPVLSTADGVNVEVTVP